MGNILDYLDWRGDLTFEQSPFNEVDNLILACFSYIESGWYRVRYRMEILFMWRSFQRTFLQKKRMKKSKRRQHSLQNIPELLRKMAKSSRIPEMQSGWFCQ